jgi:hypothetical protein
MPVDAGALHAQHRVDSSKPVDSKAIPGVLIDVVIDTEKDRGGTTPAGCVVQPQRRLSVGHPAVRTASEIRRVRPARFAVLVVADDVQARCT